MQGDVQRGRLESRCRQGIGAYGRQSWFHSEGEAVCVFYQGGEGRPQFRGKCLPLQNLHEYLRLLSGSPAQTDSFGEIHMLYQAFPVLVEVNQNY